MSEIPNTVSAPLPDVMAANTRYIVTLSTDGTTVKESLWTWPTGTMLVNAPDGTVQLIATTGSPPLIPLACMDLSLTLPLFYTSGTKSIGINSGSYDASGAAASAQAFAIQRSNQTGTQIASTVSDFSAASLLAVTWSTLTGKPTFSTVATSGSYSDLSSKPTIPPATTLTTTGSSGVSTFNASTGALNIPTYANSGGTVTSVVAGSGLSGGTITGTGTLAVNTSQNISTLSNLTSAGFVKCTASGVLSVDTATYLTGNQTITLSSDVTGSGTTAITTTLKNTGTAGTYSGVTTDAQGRVTAGTARSINDAPARSIVTTAAAANGVQISATRDAFVRYDVATSTTSTIAGSSSVVVVLEICATNSAVAANWTAISTIQNSQAFTLAVALQGIQNLTQSLGGIIPAGYFSRQRSTITGTGSATASTQQECLL